MRNALAITFAVVIFISVVAWVVGLLTVAVVPLFGGISAERIGAMGFTAGVVGECCTYGFGRLRKRTTRSNTHAVRGFPGPKKYGHKDDAV